MSTSQEFVEVQYVGLKDQETDHLYGTGLTWTGVGDVQKVPADKWSAMKKHVDVWRKVGDKPVAQPKPAEVAMRPAPLDKLNDVEIHVLAKERGYRLHNKLAGENLRAKFLEAETADERVKRDVIAE